MPFEANPAPPESFRLPQIKTKHKPPEHGRAVGTVNKITRDLKSGIIDAATAYGSDGQGTGGLTGYLFMLAGDHPKAFASLLGKMLPLQVSSSIQNLIGQVNIVSIPADHYLSREDARKLAEPPIVEHERETPQAASAVDPTTDDAA
jgi:hypothetical protein